MFGGRGMWEKLAGTVWAVIILSTLIFIIVLENAVSLALLA